MKIYLGLMGVKTFMKHGLRRILSRHILNSHKLCHFVYSMDLKNILESPLQKNCWTEIMKITTLFKMCCGFLTFARKAQENWVPGKVLALDEDRVKSKSRRNAFKTRNPDKPIKEGWTVSKLGDKGEKDSTYILNDIVKCGSYTYSKICSINFEPPDIDLCSVCHVYTISRGALIISILFIVNRFTWGSN